MDKFDKKNKMDKSKLFGRILAAVLAVMMVSGLIVTLVYAIRG